MAGGPIFHLQSQHHSISTSSSVALASLSLSLLLPLLPSREEDPVITLGSRDNLGPSPVPRCLIESHLQGVFCRIREHIHRFWALGPLGYLWGAHYSAPRIDGWVWKEGSNCGGGQGITAAGTLEFQFSDLTDSSEQRLGAGTVSPVLQTRPPRAGSAGGKHLSCLLERAKGFGFGSERDRHSRKCREVTAWS